MTGFNTGGGGGGGRGAYVYAGGSLLIAAGGEGGAGNSNASGGAGGKTGEDGGEPEPLEAKNAGGGASLSEAGTSVGGCCGGGSGRGGDGRSFNASGAGGGGGGHYGGGGGFEDSGGGGGSDFVGAGGADTIYDDGGGGVGEQWQAAGSVSFTYARVQPAVSLVPSSVAPTVGAAVLYIATLSPATYTGTVRFEDAGNPIAGCEAVAVSGAQASCTATYDAVGSHRVTASFLANAEEVFLSSARSAAALVDVVAIETPPNEPPAPILRLPDRKRPQRKRRTAHLRLL
jgi:hypothetical protein